MLNIFLIISFILLFTLLIGRVLEKFWVPWIFAALLLGLVAAGFKNVLIGSNLDTFEFIAEVGMLLLLFIIGFEIDLDVIRKKGKSILLVSLGIVCFESIIGSVLIHFLFELSWVISMVVAFSFATVGEAVLVPILDRFGIINTNLGQFIIGLGTIDDLIEVLVLGVAVSLVDVSGTASILTMVLSLGILLALSLILLRLGKNGHQFKFRSIESLFVFVLFMLFLFVGVGSMSGAESLGAILAGVVVRNLIHKERLANVESELRTMSYGFFAPIFFFWVSFNLDWQGFFHWFWLIVLISLITFGLKLLASFMFLNNELGWRQSLMVGVGVSVRFSISIVVLKIMHTHGLINDEVYNVMIYSSIILTLILPFIFSNMISRWKKYIQK